MSHPKMQPNEENIDDEIINERTSRNGSLPSVSINSNNPLINNKGHFKFATHNVDRDFILEPNTKLERKITSNKKKTMNPQRVSISFLAIP